MAEYLKSICSTYISLHGMMESVRYECGQQVQLRQQCETINESTQTMEDPQGIGNVLCTHDGVLLKKASAEYISDLNISGALSIVEYMRPRSHMYLEWLPNENILIADDSQDRDWALVDTISRRARTTSECKAFNTRPIEASITSGSLQIKPRIFRTLLQELSSIEVKHRGQIIRFLRKDSVHSEFFFQHGNADIFVQSMRQLHIIDSVPSFTRGGEEYVILTAESQKLKKTFAELDIGDIKSSRLGNESWLPNKVVGFLVNIPDYVQPPFHRGSSKSWQGTLIHGERQKSPDKYQMVGLSGSAKSDLSSLSENCITNSNKSPDENEIENVKELVDTQIIGILPERQIVARGVPLNKVQWMEFRMPDGHISDSTSVLEIIFRGGIEPALRSEVWKYLLNYYQWSDSDFQRVQHRKQKSMEYYNMKAQWLSMTSIQEENFSGYRDRKCQIEKDVKRTDRTQEFFAGENNPNLLLLHGILMTYVMYNFDLGYVQGMSDLLAPILEIQENEVDAFWCFVGFMDMVFANFDVDQEGMKIQFSQLRCLLQFANPRLFNYVQTHDSDNMYFCFRWLLVWYKRELCSGDVPKLWECFWTRLPCSNFHLLFSVALLDQQTQVIIENKYEFTEILKHVNELSGHINLDSTLELAESIYLQLKASDSLPNEIRRIIGEPLLPNEIHSFAKEEDFCEDFDEILSVPTPQEKQRQHELLEEACERSMFLQHI